MTIEVMSQILRHRIADPIDAILRVYYREEDGQLNQGAYYGSPLGSFSDDGFEPTDAILLDLVLPADGEYVVEVDTFSINIPELHDYLPNFDVDQFRAAYPDDQATLDRDTGDYELFVYAFQGVSASRPKAAGDTMVGGAGSDTMIGNSGNETYFADPSDIIEDPSGMPTLAGNSPIHAREGDRIRFLANTAISDPRFSLEPLDQIQYPTGATIHPITGEFRWIATDDGPFEVMVVVTNPASPSVRESREVQFLIDNVAPTVETGVDQTVDEGDTLSIAPTFTDAGSADTHTAAINWGDGTTDAIAPATSLSNWATRWSWSTACSRVP